MRFLVDENLPFSLIRLLQKSGHEIRTTTFTPFDSTGPRETPSQTVLDTIK